MSQLKLTADGGGGTVSLKGPSTTTGNAAIELTVPGTGNATLLTDLSNIGKLLQVKQTTQPARISSTLTDNVFTDISGLSVNITPTAASSKILVSYHLQVCTTVGNYNIMTRMMRGSTPIGIGDQVGSNRRRASNVVWTNSENYQGLQMDNMFLDSPNTTSSTTYKLQWTDSYGQTVYLNRIITDSDTKYYPNTMSHITVQEIAA